MDLPGLLPSYSFILNPNVLRSSSPSTWVLLFIWQLSTLNPGFLILQILVSSHGFNIFQLRSNWINWISSRKRLWTGRSCQAQYETASKASDETQCHGIQWRLQSASCPATSSRSPAKLNKPKTSRTQLRRLFHDSKDSMSISLTYSHLLRLRGFLHLGLQTRIHRTRSSMHPWNCRQRWNRQSSQEVWRIRICDLWMLCFRNQTLQRENCIFELSFRSNPTTSALAFILIFESEMFQCPASWHP